MRAWGAARTNTHIFHYSSLLCCLRLHQARLELFLLLRRGLRLQRRRLRRLLLLLLLLLLLGMELLLGMKLLLLELNLLGLELLLLELGLLGLLVLQLLLLLLRRDSKQSHREATARA